MKLLITGLSHHTAPVEVREKLAFEEKTLPEALDRLCQRPGMVEGMILSTCNRVEVAVTAEEHSDPTESVDRFLAEARSVEPAWVSPYLYHYNGPDAIRHVFRVASSLDSMIVGEPQILGQLKNAYALAKERGSVNGYLDLVMTRAFNVAKRVRTETEIGSSAVSVSYAAVELARDIFGELSGKRVLLVGAGKMAESAARHLRRAGVSDILVTNRTRSRAEALAEEFHGRVIEYEDMTHALPDVDIVIASSGAPHYILTKDIMRSVINRRRNRPMFLIDIAVPRNIDPGVNDLENLFLYDIDDLQGVVNANLKERNKEAERAEAIVASEVEKMIARLHVQEVAPTIVSLQEQLEEIRAAEVAKTLRRLPNLSPQDRDAIEAMTRAIMNKVAHGPISALRHHAGHPEGAQVISAIRRVFHIDS